MGNALTNLGAAPFSIIVLMSMAILAVVISQLVNCIVVRRMKKHEASSNSEGQGSLKSWILVKLGIRKREDKASTSVDGKFQLSILQAASNFISPLEAGNKKKQSLVGKLQQKIKEEQIKILRRSSSMSSHHTQDAGSLGGGKNLLSVNSSRRSIRGSISGDSLREEPDEEKQDKQGRLVVPSLTIPQPTPKTGQQRGSIPVAMLPSIKIVNERGETQVPVERKKSTLQPAAADVKLSVLHGESFKRAAMPAVAGEGSHQTAINSKQKTLSEIRREPTVVRAVKKEPSVVTRPSQVTPDPVKREPTTVAKRSQPTPELVKKEQTTVAKRSQPTPELVKKEPTTVVKRSQPTPELVKKEPTAVKKPSQPTADPVKREPTGVAKPSQTTPEPVKTQSSIITRQRASTALKREPSKPLVAPGQAKREPSSFGVQEREANSRIKKEPTQVIDQKKQQQQSQQVKTALAEANDTPPSQGPSQNSNPEPPKQLTAFRGDSEDLMIPYKIDASAVAPPPKPPEKQQTSSSDDF